jgi:hypothetical protein
VLRSVDDVTPGQTVYLYPHTRTSGQYCWLRKPAVVVDAKTHWPSVRVALTHEGNDVETLIHKDDIKLRPDTTTKKKGGDMASGDHTLPAVGESRRLAMTTTKIENLEGQMELF